MISLSMISGFILFALMLLFDCNKDNFPQLEKNLALEQNVDNFIKTYVTGISPGISILVRKEK